MHTLSIRAAEVSARIFNYRGASGTHWARKISRRSDARRRVLLPPVEKSRETSRKADGEKSCSRDPTRIPRPSQKSNGGGPLIPSRGARFSRAPMWRGLSSRSTREMLWQFNAIGRANAQCTRFSRPWITSLTKHAGPMQPMLPVPRGRKESGWVELRAAAIGPGDIFAVSPCSRLNQEQPTLPFKLRATFRVKIHN